MEPFGSIIFFKLLPTQKFIKWGYAPNPKFSVKQKHNIRKEGGAVERITIKVKPDSRKMTPEELQGYLKAKAMGSGVTKNGKAYSRRDKHRNRLHDGY